MIIAFTACWIALSTPTQTCERVEIRTDPTTSALFCELAKQRAAADWLAHTDRRDARIVGAPVCLKGEQI